MLIFAYILLTVSAILAVPVVMFSLYLALLTLGSLIPRRIKLREKPDTKIAVIIPAHNEEAGIEKAVSSLLAVTDYQAELFTIITVAANCTDSTAYIANFAGAEVLEYANEWKPGRGFAVEWALSHLKNKKYDLFLILDPDSRLGKDALKYLDAEFDAGHIAMQLPAERQTSSASRLSLLKSLPESAENFLQPRGRDRIGFSSPLTGNGTALSAEILEQIPFEAGGENDTSEYFYKLVCGREKARFICGRNCAVLVPPDSLESARRNKMPKRFFPKLIKEAFNGNFTAAETLLNIFLPPYATLFAGALILLFSGAMLFFAGGLPETAVFTKYGIILLIAAVCSTILLVIYIITGIAEKKLLQKTE
jgi:glycosyltransferase involved in cell wall biosynthesis